MLAGMMMRWMTMPGDALIKAPAKKSARLKAVPESPYKIRLTIP